MPAIRHFLTKTMIFYYKHKKEYLINIDENLTKFYEPLLSEKFPNLK